MSMAKADWLSPSTGHGKAHLFVRLPEENSLSFVGMPDGYRRVVCKTMSFSREYIPEECTHRKRKHCIVCERRAANYERN